MSIIQNPTVAVYFAIGVVIALLYYFTSDGLYDSRAVKARDAAMLSILWPIAVAIAIDEVVA